MKKSRTLILTVAILSGLACAGASATKPEASAPAMETDEQKTFYALGLLLSGKIESFALTPAELELVKAGLADGATGATPKVDLATYGPKVNEIAKARLVAAAGVEKQKGTEYVAKVAAEPGAQKLPSGIIYVETQAGTGESPKATDNVQVHYTGTLIDGKEFDSSVKRGQPAQFALNGVIPCWTEGLQKMKVGGKAKLVCPSDQAYGDAGRPPTIRPGATLVFEIELLSIQK